MGTPSCSVPPSDVLCSPQPLKTQLWGDTETPPPPPRTIRSHGFICPELLGRSAVADPATGGQVFSWSPCAHHPFSSLQLDIPSTYMQETSPLCLLMLHLPSWHREHLFSWHWAPSN